MFESSCVSLNVILLVMLVHLLLVVATNVMKYFQMVFSGWNLQHWAHLCWHICVPASPKIACVCICVCVCVCVCLKLP